MNTDSGYTIIKGNADNDELKNYRLCFQKNGTQRDIENLQWLHQKNLAKFNTIYYAMHNETVAGIYTALPVIFNIDGAKLLALQSIDTMTDKGHRGKGLFPKLANKLYKEAQENNFELVYGFPNINSAPGFFNKLQWHSFGQAPFLFKPLNPLYFIKKIFFRKKISDLSNSNYIYDAPEAYEIDNNTKIQAFKDFDANYDLIWEKVSKNIKVAVDRSAAYMNWRYVLKPGEHYYRYGIYINGKLEGVIVYSIKKKHGGIIGYIMDLIYDPAKRFAGKQLLKFASQQIKKQKSDVILCWSIPGTFNYHCFKKCGYFSLPLKLRPQQLYLGVRVFNNAKKELILNIKNWYISYSDSDTV